MGLTALEPRILLDAAAVVTGAEVITDNMLQEQTDLALTALMENVETEDNRVQFEIAAEDMTLSDSDMAALSPVKDTSEGNSFTTIKVDTPLYATGEGDSFSTIKVEAPLVSLSDDGNFEIHSGETINVDLRANDYGGGDLAGIIDPADPETLIALTPNENVTLSSGLGVELLDDGTFNITAPEAPTSNSVSFDYIVEDEQGETHQATATFDWPVAQPSELAEVQRFNGPVDFVVTGGSFRTSATDGTAVSTSASSEIVLPANVSTNDIFSTRLF